MCISVFVVRGQSFTALGTGRFGIREGMKIFWRVCEGYKFFSKLHFHIYQLNIQIQISLMLGNLHSASLSTDISTHQANKE